MNGYRTGQTSKVRSIVIFGNKLSARREVCGSVDLDTVLSFKEFAAVNIRINNELDVVGYVNNIAVDRNVDLVIVGHDRTFNAGYIAFLALGGDILNVDIVVIRFQTDIADFRFRAKAQSDSFIGIGIDKTDFEFIVSRLICRPVYDFVV